MNHPAISGWVICVVRLQLTFIPRAFPSSHTQLTERVLSVCFSPKLLVLTILLPLHIWLLLVPDISNDTVCVFVCLRYLTRHVIFAGIQGNFPLDLLAQNILNSYTIQLLLIKKEHNVVTCALSHWLRNLVTCTCGVLKHLSRCLLSKAE